MLNTKRWDFAQVAALVAPRPLLITNTDKDRIFPLDGVVDVYTKVQKIYALHDAEHRLGLQISEGPHKDTQELRVAAFRWFNRFLKDDTKLLEKTAEKFLEPQDLKVFKGELPSDEIVTTIDESFVAQSSLVKTPIDSSEKYRQAKTLLRAKCFSGWPANSEPLDVKKIGSYEHEAVTLTEFQFTSQSPYRLSFYVATGESSSDSPGGIRVVAVNQDQWEKNRAAIDLIGTEGEPESEAKQL